MYQMSILIGNLGNDPEMRYLPDGTPVCSFNLAVNRRWTNAQGVKQEKTTWFKVTCWRKLAETVSQYVTKGRQVLVQGDIEEARPWTDRDGNQRASIELTAQDVRFLGGNGQATDIAEGKPARAVKETGGASQESSAVDDRDIPF